MAVIVIFFLCLKRGVILLENNKLPYTRVFDDYRMILAVRRLRNLTLRQFESYMEVDHSTIAKLEKGFLDFSVHYESKFRLACERLQVSEIEINSLKKVLKIRDK
jgi:transcriptional regulator with XRE-family HTH domain